MAPLRVAGAPYHVTLDVPPTCVLQLYTLISAMLA